MKNEINWRSDVPSPEEFPELKSGFAVRSFKALMVAGIKFEDSDWIELHHVVGHWWLNPKNDFVSPRAGVCETGIEFKVKSWVRLEEL